MRDHRSHRGSDSIRADRRIPCAHVVASRTILETQAGDIRRRHPDGTGIPRPQRWGGFRVLPSRVEFWQESPDGLHDRIRYRREGDSWTIERLSP
jgi:pyridoxamine 5'-phosphate oxidase